MKSLEKRAKLTCLLHLFSLKHSRPGCKCDKRKSHESVKTDVLKCCKPSQGKARRVPFAASNTCTCFGPTFLDRIPFSKKGHTYSCIGNQVAWFMWTRDCMRWNWSLCLLISRLEYPCRYSDLINWFGQPVPEIFLITNHQHLTSLPFHSMESHFNEPTFASDICWCYKKERKCFTKFLGLNRWYSKTHLQTTRKLKNPLQRTQKSTRFEYQSVAFASGRHLLLQSSLYYPLFWTYLFFLDFYLIYHLILASCYVRNTYFSLSINFHDGFKIAKIRCRKNVI